MAKETAVTKTEPMALENVDAGPLFSPAVDIIEKGDSIVILADMPGVSRDGLDVVLEKGVLTVRGKVKRPDSEQMDYDVQEYEVGDFYRSFAVGDGLNTKGVEAEFKNGVLRLVIPKAEEYKPRRIQIKSE
jgi:HSP20 family protein